MILLSRIETEVNLRIQRTPRGPTLHFKVHSYSLTKDVKNHQKTPKDSLNDYLNPPLVHHLYESFLTIACSEWLYDSQGRQTFSGIESPYFDFSTSFSSPVRTDYLSELNPSRPPLQQNSNSLQRFLFLFLDLHRPIPHRHNRPSPLLHFHQTRRRPPYSPQNLSQIYAPKSQQSNRRSRLCSKQTRL